MNLDIVLCPGCAKRLPVKNNGCPSCGYEWGEADSEDLLHPFRIPPLVWFLKHHQTTIRAMDDVSLKFIAKILRMAQCKK